MRTNRCSYTLLQGKLEARAYITSRSTPGFDAVRALGAGMGVFQGEKMIRLGEVPDDATMVERGGHTINCGGPAALSSLLLNGCGHSCKLET